MITIEMVDNTYNISCDACNRAPNSLLRINHGGKFKADLFLCNTHARSLLSKLGKQLKMEIKK